MKQRRAKGGPSQGGVAPVTSARGRGGVPARAHAVSRINAGESNATGVNASGVSFVDYTREQVKEFLNMLTNNSQNNNNSNINNAQLDKMTGESVVSWIIDTSASRHVTGDASRLTDIVSIIASPVCLPDGSLVIATKEGRAPLSGKLTLENVLYVPTLNCNFISVSQLIDDPN